MLDAISMLTHKSKDISSTVYLFMADVTTESCAELIGWILNHNFEPENPEEGYFKPESLTVLINSPGGDLDAVSAAIDVMRGSSIPVRTIGIGQIASAGLLLFMAGEKGQRVLSENCSVMSHSFSTGIMGNKHDLFAAQRSLSLTHDKMLRFYQKFTQLDKEVIEQKLMSPTDTYLTPEECVQYGIADHISNLK